MLSLSHLYGSGKVVPFNASFMILKRLREALWERGVSWCYPVMLPFLFILPLASTATHTSRWSRQERNCILSESRFSSIFTIFLRIAPILVDGKIVKMQLWQPATGYSLFGQNFKFNARTFLRHFFNFQRLQSGAKSPIFIGYRCCQGPINLIYVNFKGIPQPLLYPITVDYYKF